MKRPKLKDITELIGVAAIVISMAAITYELRQTKSALISSTYQERAIDAINELNFISDSEFLLPVLITTNYGADTEAVEKLNDIEHGRLLNYLRARMIDWDNEYYQYINGYLTEDFFQTTTKPLVKMFAPRWRAIGLSESTKEFSNFIDVLLAEEPE